MLYYFMHFLSWKEMQRNRVLKKYHHSLCNLFNFYRFFGIIYFDNYGRITKKLRLCSILSLTFQTIVLYIGIYLHTQNNYSKMDTVSKIPFILQSFSLSSHYMVTGILFYRKNDVMVKLFARMERIRSTMITVTEEQRFLKNIKCHLLLTFLVLILLVVASVTLTESAVNYSWDFKVILLMSYLLSFITYLRELIIFVYLMLPKVVLEVMNEKLRIDSPAVSLIKQFRFVQ